MLGWWPKQVAGSWAHSPTSPGGTIHAILLLFVINQLSHNGGATMKRRMGWLSGSLILSLVLPSFAQRILGEFTGTVTDPSQAAVAGAKVVAVDAATGRS